MPAIHERAREGRPSGEGGSEREPSEVRHLFGRIARRYDLLNHLLSLNLDRRWRRRTVELLGLGPMARVLDVCTGTADIALALGRRVDPVSGGLVAGTDFSMEMLHLARRKIGRADTPVLLAGADTMRLPFRDGIFDGVTIGFGLRNLADWREGMAEMHRILHPGGRIAILEFSLPTSPWFHRIYRFYLRHVLPPIGRWVSGRKGDAYSYLSSSVQSFPEPREISGLLSQAGFRNVIHHPLSRGVVTVYLGAK